MTTMPPWTLRMPVPVEFGTGGLERLPGFMPGLRRALVVTGRQAMKRAGVTARLGAVLDAAGIAHAVFDDLSAEPEHAEISSAGRSRSRPSLFCHRHSTRWGRGNASA